MSKWHNHAGNNMVRDLSIRVILSFYVVVGNKLYLILSYLKVQVLNEQMA